MKPNCVEGSALGLLGLRWRVLSFLGTPCFGNPKGGKPLSSPRTWSNLFSSPEIWRASGTLNNLTSSCH